MSARLAVVLLANTALGAVTVAYSTNNATAIAAIAKSAAVAELAQPATVNEPKPSLAALEACRVIGDALPKKVHLAGARAYQAELYEYWNAALREIKPACMVMPDTAQDVEKAVKLLGNYPDVRFAVKSGGHTPNAGQSSTDGGVLISMTNVRGVKYNKAKDVAYVKPGGKWRDVIGPLNKEKVAVLGGRLGVVGVGGLLAQGGLSFLSAQYGLAADNIVEYELVQPNGTLTKVNMDNNKELMVAMRGHGEQFGIITQYTLRTVPMNKIWGGYRIYGTSSKDKLFAGLHDFIANGDSRAAIIMNHQLTYGSTNVFLVHFFYDGETPPKGAFGATLKEVPATLDFTAVRTYPELLNLNGFGIDLANARAGFRTVTLPYFPEQPGFYGELIKIWDQLSKPILAQKEMSVLGVAFQPLPNSIGKASKLRGGNAMGLTDTDNHRFILEMSSIYWAPQLEPIITETTAQLAQEAKALASKYLAASPKPELVEKYLPLFLNDANDDQDVIGSYKDFDAFAKLQQSVDPKGMFAQRAGTIKFSKARKQFVIPETADKRKFKTF